MLDNGNLALRGSANKPHTAQAILPNMEEEVVVDGGSRGNYIKVKKRQKLYLGGANIFV